MSERDAPAGHPKGRFRRLVAEARRRRVIRTVVFYAGGAAAVVEGADIFSEPLGLPGGTVRLLAILAVCLLPAVVAASWAYEVIPEPRDVESGARLRAALWARHGMVAGAVLLSGGAAVALWSRTPPPSFVPEASRSRDLSAIAILPLETSEPSLEALAASLHGRLIDGLSEAGRAVGDPGREQGGLRVISRPGVMPFAGRHVPPDSIGRELSVGTIVAGTVESTTGRIQVRLSLIDAVSAAQLGGTVAGADLGDNVALLEAVADSLSELLRKGLGGVVRERMRLAESTSPEALDRLLDGEALIGEAEFAFATGNTDAAARLIARADSAFAEAARADPEWAEPVRQRAALATSLAAPVEAARQGGDVQAVLERGLVLADRAVRLDPENSETLHTRGALRYQLAQGADDISTDRIRELIEGAESDLRAAIHRNPRPARPLRRLSELLASQGRLEEAYEYGRRSYEEDPYMEGRVQTLLRLFEHSLRLDRDEEAAGWCGEGLDRGERLFLFLDCRLQLLAWSETVDADPAEAWDLVQRELRSYPAPLRPTLRPRLHALAAAVLARAGMVDSARVVLGRAWEEDRGTGGLLLTAAGIHARLGESEIAYSLLERLWQGYPEQRARLPTAPELRPLRTDPRFQAMVARGDPGG